MTRCLSKKGREYIENNIILVLLEYGALSFTGIFLGLKKNKVKYISKGRVASYLSSFKKQGIVKNDRFRRNLSYHKIPLWELIID